MIKKLVIIGIILYSTILNATADDKFKHMYVGVGIYAGCLMTYGIVENMGYSIKYDKATICLAPVIIAGAGKEIWDSTKENHEAEFADFAYTIAVPLSMSVVLYKW